MRSFPPRHPPHPTKRASSDPFPPTETRLAPYRSRQRRRASRSVRPSHTHPPSLLLLLPPRNTRLRVTLLLLPLLTLFLSNLYSAEAKIKRLEQELLTKDHELTSLQHKVTTLETSLDAAEQQLNESKSAKDDHESNKSQNENLTRKIALLESELDNSEKQLRETTDK